VPTDANVAPSPPPPPANPPLPPIVRGTGSGAKLDCSGDGLCAPDVSAAVAAKDVIGGMRPVGPGVAGLVMALLDFMLAAVPEKEGEPVASAQPAPAAPAPPVPAVAPPPAPMPYPGQPLQIMDDGTLKQLQQIGGLPSPEAQMGALVKLRDISVTQGDASGVATGVASGNIGDRAGIVVSLSGLLGNMTNADLATLRGALPTGP
jgi:hypothetical protein